MRGFIIVLLLLTAIVSACGSGEQIPTLAPTANIIPSQAPKSSFDETKLELPPTNTPPTGQEKSEQAQSLPSPESIVQIPTQKSVPVITITHPEPVLPPAQPESGTGPIGALRVDSWLFDVTDIRSDPGMDASRQSIVLLGYLTNEGSQNDTFVPFGSIMLRDSGWREYEDDHRATWAAQDKYGADSGASMNPGASEYVAFAYDAPISERTFTIIPGSLAANWSGDLVFTLPPRTEPDQVALPTSPAPSSQIGYVRFDSWLFEISQAISDPGMDSSRQSIVLLGILTNEGNQTDTFTAFGDLVLRDSRGREYEDDNRATWAAEDKYATDYSSSINPGARRYIAVAFDAPASERTFTIIPGSLVASWSGNVSFAVP